MPAWRPRRFAPQLTDPAGAVSVASARVQPGLGSLAMACTRICPDLPFPPRVRAHPHATSGACCSPPPTGDSLDRLVIPGPLAAAQWA